MAFERFDNRASFLGRLTADPEYKTVGDNDTAMVTFRIAVQRPKSGNNDHPEADFIPCTVWGKQAEIIAKHFIKGNKIGVSGAIQTRTYEDKDGNKRNAWDLQVGAFSFIEKRATVNRCNLAERKKIACTKILWVPDNDSGTHFSKEAHGQEIYGKFFKASNL